MPDRTDWEALERAALDALPMLDFLLGEWEGSGEAHGQPLTGRLTARRILGGTVVETRESLYDADGALDHEDLALYRVEPDRGLFVQHLQAPGWSSEHAVEPVEDGIAWESGPVEPRVVLHREGEALVTAVLFPYDPQPVAIMRYRKVAP